MWPGATEEMRQEGGGLNSEDNLIHLRTDI